MIDQSFVYFPAADLATLKAQCLACLSDNFVAAQSYTIAGRTITRANVGQVAGLLASINYAIAYQARTVKRLSVASFNHGC